MFVKITAKRQVTYPARQVERARLAPLRGKLRRGQGSFDLAVFRAKPHARALRD